MPQIIEVTVYPIDELSDAAKEAARAWYRESCLDYEWYDCVYEDFETICRILVGDHLKARIFDHFGERACHAGTA